MNKQLIVRLCWVAQTACLVCLAQGQDAPSADVPQGLPAGLRLTSLSTYVGGYSVVLPQAGGEAGASSTPFVMGGSAATLTWSFPGSRVEAVATYTGAYNRNQRFTELNGADHWFSFVVRTNYSQRTTFDFEAVGESTLLANSLFEPTHSLTVAQGSASGGDLASGLTGDPSLELTESPLVLFLSGGRRMMGGVHARVTHSHTPRLQSQLRIGAARDQHSPSATPEFAALYPSATLGMAEASIRYAVSPRTRIDWTADYWRSYARAYRLEVETATMGLERTIRRASFVRLEGGYARTTSRASGITGLNGYTASGALGTTKANHTFVVSARRSVADLHGLRSDTTISADGAWFWQRRACPWSLASSFGYERVYGLLGLLDTWIYRGVVARHLTPNVQLQFEGAYAKSDAASLMDFARRGVRLSLIWTPGAAPVRGH